MGVFLLGFVSLALADPAPDLDALEAFYRRESDTRGSVKEPTSLRQVGTHTATTSKQAFLSGVMEAGLPGVKDVQRIRRYVESLKSIDGQKGLLAHLKEVNRTEKAFDKKNQARRAAYNLEQHTIAFLANFDERKSVDEARNQRALKHLFHIERSHEALVEGIQAVHAHRDIFEQRYKRRLPKKMEQHESEMRTLIQLAQSEPHKKILSDSFTSEAFQQWKEKHALKREKTLDRARLNGTHLGEAANFAYDATMATVITLGSGGSLAGGAAAGIALHGTNRVSNGLMRELETKKIRDIRNSNLDKDEKNALIQKVRGRLALTKNVKDVVLSVGHFTTSAHSFLDMSTAMTLDSGTHGNEVAKEKFTKVGNLYGFHKATENVIDATSGAKVAVERLVNANRAASKGSQLQVPPSGSLVDEVPWQIESGDRKKVVRFADDMSERQRPKRAKGVTFLQKKRPPQVDLSSNPVKPILKKDEDAVLDSIKAVP